METVNPTRNVLVAVDVQHDFIDGSLAVAEGKQVVTPRRCGTMMDKWFLLATGTPLKHHILVILVASGQFIVSLAQPALPFMISLTCDPMTLLSTKAWVKLTGILVGRVKVTQARRWRPSSHHEHLARRFRYFSAGWQLTFA